MLGHSSINTAQFYVNLVAQDIQDALDKAMESGSPMQPPPPSLADGAAQHSLNRTNRLQAAFKAKRAAQAHSTDSTKATKDIGVSVLQELEVEVESPSEVDATAVFLALHASLTRERQEDLEKLRNVGKCDTSLRSRAQGVRSRGRRSGTEIPTLSTLNLDFRF